MIDAKTWSAAKDATYQHQPSDSSRESMGKLKLASPAHLALDHAALAIDLSGVVPPFGSVAFAALHARQRKH